MNIEINKDFKNSYKDDFWRGFSLREVACVVLGLCVWAAVALVTHFAFGLKLNAAVFLGFPFSTPVFVFGFFRPQNRLSIVQYLAEMRYSTKTKSATYSSLEDPGVEMEAYSMEIRGINNKSRKLPYKKKRGGKERR